MCAYVCVILSVFILCFMPIFGEIKMYIVCIINISTITDNCFILGNVVLG